MTEKIFHKSMPCKHCEQMAVHAPLPKLELLGIHVYFCDPCKAEYVYHEDYTMWSESIYVTVNSKMFRWTRSALGSGQIWFIGVPGIPGVIENKEVSLIKHFDEDIPIINPSNIYKKLHTLLTFL